MSSETIRVLIVARYATVRAGLRYLLALSTDVEVVGEAASAVEARGVDADVLVVDDSLIDRAGLIEVVDERGCGLVLLTDESDAAGVLSTTSTSGWGVLPASADGASIAAAVRAVAAGLIVVDRGLDGLFRRAVDEEQADLGPDLTPREGQVLQLMAAGLANKQIAGKLGVSAHTVKFHVASILSKLGASTRAEAVAIGARRGLLMV